MSINQALARDFGLRLSRAAGSVDAKANMLAARGATDEAAVLRIRCAQANERCGRDRNPVQTLMLN